jgi:hypothetical protein
MIMNFLKFNLAVLGLIIFSACQQNPHISDISTIERLRVELDSAELVFSKIDTSGYAAFEKKYKRNVAFVQQKLLAKGDTMDRETALFMSEYRELKKPYAQFKTKYEQAEKELEFSENQLITLKHDLKNNNMDTIISKRMMADEVKATESIVSSVKNLYASDQKIRAKTAEMEPRIDSLMNVLKQY